MSAKLTDLPTLDPTVRDDRNKSPTSTLTTDELPSDKARLSKWQKFYSVVAYTPPRCRYDPSIPPSFSMGLNVLFAFAGCFTVANLYYNHPILDILAKDFGVTYEQASYIPTVAQAGYAAGLLFLCPLGDLFKRRPFVLWLVWFTATVWYASPSKHLLIPKFKLSIYRIGLCITKNFTVFCILSFITSVSTVTPQLMLPLVGDLAPPARRATSLSIVVSGLLLGMLIARVLSGTITNFISWRAIYWLSLGLQYFILALLWLFMPDYPSTNPSGLSYPRILSSILTMVLKHPVLVQACLVGFFTSATFTSFWTTLTFLLSSPPFSYSPLIIGLFALIGIGAMTLGPPYARTIIDNHVPLFSVILGETYCLIGVIIGTFTGTFTVAGPVIQAFAIDLGLQTSQIANRTAIYAIEPKARNRVNTAYMVAVFCGQLMGTAAGNHLYARGGWKRSDGASIGFLCGALCVCFARGPWEKGWVGWRGGWGIKRRDWGQAEDSDLDGRESDVEKGGGGGNGEGGGQVREKERGEQENDIEAGRVSPVPSSITATVEERERDGEIQRVDEK
jgi:predicted MFS family arabinose efflux permease